MTKYDEAIAEAQAFTEKYRDAALPIMVLIAETVQDGENFTIEKVATLTHFTEGVQRALCAIAINGDEATPIPKGQN